jgi:hypothetical protein
MRNLAGGILEVAVTLTMLLLCIFLLAASALSPSGRSGAGGQRLGEGDADARRI